MSGVSMPVNRPIGRALIVGSPSTRSQPLATLQRHGYICAEADDPYAAMAELCRRPLVYRAIIFSLASVYKEELAMIATVKRRFPHVEMWLTNTDGRQALMIEAMRLGAEGLVAEDGLHRLAIGSAPHAPLDPSDMPRTAMEPMVHAEHDTGSPDVGEAVLTADELRALLQEQPAVPRSEHE
jgi:hypothetical protein